LSIKTYRDAAIIEKKKPHGKSINR
jgi:hypothetical protein